jgi:tetratricopeptide (TPR) repeat protein
LATSLNINGNVYFKKGNYPLSLDYYFKALKINEGIKNNKGIASQLNNIGNVFSAMNDIPKALDYSIKSLNIFKKLGDKTLIAHTLSNIGGLYMGKKDYINANEYILKSITIYNELGDTQNIGRSITIIGMIESNKGNYNEALNYFFKAISLNDTNDKENTATLYGNIGEALMNEKKYVESKKYYMKSLNIGIEIGSLGIISESAHNLSNIYDKTGNKTLSFYFYKQFVSAKDSLTNEENTKNIVRSEMNFEFEKQNAITKAEQEKKDAVALSESHKQQFVMYASIIGSIMLIVFLVIMYNRFKVIKKQKHIIEIQKDEVLRQKHIVDESFKLLDEKNKEVMASIRYAQKIQQSLLTSQSYINNTLNRLMKPSI